MPIDTASNQLSNLGTTAGANITGKDTGSNWLQNNTNLFNQFSFNTDFSGINVDTFFYTSLANPWNWNQYFPYQIMILQENNTSRS